MLNRCIFVAIYALFLLSVVVSEIPLGSKISVSENELWVSSNGDFALGFFKHPVRISQYSLGIRFHSDSIPVDQQVLVWAAGAELTVSNSSYFELTQEGVLVLYDSLNGGIVWTSNLSAKSVSSSSLQDDGNLVILDGNKELLWQSFDTPSDTLLPGQKLLVHKKLRALSKNSLSSYYSLYLSELGQLELRWESSVVYWVGGNPLNESLRASLSSNGSFQLLNEGSEPIWSAFADDHNDDVKFRFVRLDADGNLRVYSWDEDSRAWKSVWQAVENQCDVFATCGEHGICSFAKDGDATCTCPFVSRMESNSQCLAPYGQSCDSKVSMLGYKHTSLYGIYPPNDTVIITSLDSCRSLCEKDPLCTAVSYLNDGTAQCRIKKTQYISGYVDPSLTSMSFVKTCLDPVAVYPKNFPGDASLSPPSPSKDNNYNKSYRIPFRAVIDAALGTFCLFFMLQIGVGFWIWRRRVSSSAKQSSLSNNGIISAGLVRWTYADIKELTQNFKDQLGPHSYKAMLQNNQPAVAKRLKSQIEEKRFRSMVSIIGSICHRNLVKVEGYCCESGHRFLVYEFLKNGSLEKFMHDVELSRRLTWSKRMAICLGVAKGISYLHMECRDFVSHGNLKCGNVILDENLEAKLTEFGLQGLDGFDTSAEKDVEDFGKILLYLISGRQNINDVNEWSYNKWISGYGWKVVDERIKGDVNFEELERALRIAFWCLQADERMRPSMGEVVNVLQGTLMVDPPPPPFFH